MHNTCGVCVATLYLSQYAWNKYMMRALTSPGMQITALEKVRERVGLPKNERGPEDLEVAAGVHGLSEIELITFIDMAEARYRAKRMDPGGVAPCCHCYA